MQYENIELTEEQRNKLIERKIKNPYGSFMDITEGISPIYLTVDKDSENWLAEGYFHHDVEQTLNEFTFMYENVPVFVQAERIIQERHVTVKITRIDEKNGFNGKKPFLDSLTEAFKVFAACGCDDVTVEVIFNENIAIASTADRF